jgi:ATP-dependent DNA ligase
MPKKPLPQFVPPMQASSVKEPFDSPDWIFGTKLDGYRAVAVIDSGGNAHDITGKTVLQRRDRLEQIINPIPGIQVGGTSRIMESISIT